MKKQNIIGISTAFVVVIALMAVIFYPTPAPAQKLAIDTYATQESVSSLSDYMNIFTFNMYNQLSIENNENIFFSPYSIFVALAMTYEGAEGETAEEMQSILQFPQNDEVSLCSFGRIYNLLNIDKEYTLNTANALWTQKDYNFLDDYLNFINNYYMGKATNVDFKNSEQSANIINEWVEKNTKGLIKDLLSASDIDPLTKLILTNAIYFKGIWKYQFDPEDTIDAEFEISTDETINTPMMSISNNEIEFNYYETNDIQILEMPYKGDELSMIFILPKDNNISNLENELNYENFIDWSNMLSETNVQVSIPRFSLEDEYNLKEHLKNMGMNAAFSGDADFSGMTGDKDLFVGKIKHKAFIEVNEQGSEAAGATSVHMVLKSAPATMFNADHPFIYLIQHKETNTILFMGKLVNPQ